MPVNRSLTEIQAFGRGLLFLRLALLSLVASLCLVTLALIARRLSGALVSPLAFGPALMAGLSLALGSWALRLAVQRVVDTPVGERLLLICIGVAWLIVLALSSSSASPLAILALWLPMLAAEGAWHVSPPQEGAAVSPQQTAIPPAQERAVAPTAREPALTAGEVLDTTNLVQQLIRTRDPDQERISGLVRIDFAPHELSATAHIVFHPPLAHAPCIHVEAAVEDDVTVRATECRTYGVRLEAKRRRELSASSSVVARIDVNCSSHSEYA